MVYLKNHDGFNIIHNQLTEAKIQWLATESTIDLFFYWNYITFISILLEPPTHSIIHQKITITHKTIEDTEKAIMQLHHESKTVLQQIGIEKLQYFRDEICRDADRLDKNRKLHLIIRLMNDQSRKYITGKIAGAVLFKEQVEIYRRHIEEVFETKIPEEDECGFASVNTKYKLEAHGSYRLLDGERIVVNQFIRGLGLDYGIRVNVYVEGDTEYYAIKTEFEKTNHVNIINLKGAFAESRGKGLSFRENLRNDKNSKIFSVIVFDNDVSDNVRAMKKAIEDDEVVGRFFISKPDFEFENFSLEELSDIVITLSHEYGIDIDENSKFLELIGEVRSGEEFKKVITQYSNDLGRLIKGKIWGEALAIYANEHYEDFQERTIIKIFHMISACKSYSYELSKKVKINPETGNFEC